MSCRYCKHYDITKTQLHDHGVCEKIKADVSVDDNWDSEGVIKEAAYFVVSGGFGCIYYESSHENRDIARMKLPDLKIGHGAAPTTVTPGTPWLNTKTNKIEYTK